MKITLQQLKQWGACLRQRRAFKMLFGTEVEVTEEACLAVAAIFEWGWVAARLLPKAKYARYRRIAGAAWDKYELATETARAEYARARKATSDKRADASSLAIYGAIDATAWAEYQRTIAGGFARVLLQDAKTTR